ncbi:uncharacterized protein LOC115716279 [Cannabis sativa]|uniref:uncharacterized protein LOC115716279 n=1 Tax=Cannabis sativa TaxID=3483 RepID=UPI0029CA5F22|nr:uncharacterized protein LOC115716279 [Cannabis sativa]XP_060971831.1 uncharacterized protein LOC115716279 [Cannabis sativa]
MVRGRDACWEHCVLVDANRQKIRCNYCEREFSGGVYRMKFHLAQIKNKDIVPCTHVPAHVQNRILTILNTPKKHTKTATNTTKKHKLDQAAAVAAVAAAASNGRQHSSSASGGIQPHHDNGSSGHNGSICPSPSEQPPVVDVDDAEKRKQGDADKKIAVFFYSNCIPFGAAKSLCYQEMVDAILECGVGYRAPSYEKLRSSLLEKMKGELHDCYKKYREEWKESGCTILCDSWSDGGTKSLVVFSVTCPKGTLFLRSVDVSANWDDSNYMFELLESLVLEIGVENVVQVITDTEPSFLYAGRLLMVKYNSLFWSPCASCCIDKILEDIGNIDWVNTVLEEAKTITRYLYGQSWTLNMMRKFTGGKELIRPRISRYVTYFLSLRSIVIQEDNLKHMFSHTDWLSSMYSKHPEAQAIKSLIYLDRFWKYAHEAVSLSEPFVKILRIVDGDMPAMGYMYEGIERAKVSIKVYYKGVEEKYMSIWSIIDRRWNMHLNSSLHAAAAFLNPSTFYNPNFKIDLTVRNGFQEAMLKMAITDNDKMEITKECPVYIGAQGALGTQFAIMGRTINAPGDWWAGYGYEIPTLQRAAMRILSQPCSSHWCRWNWTTFESLHNKKRNKAELEKLNDLVFVHCNLWLQTIFQSTGGKSKPIIFNEIDVISEWPSELDPSTPLLDDSWLDSIPLDSTISP